MEGPGGGVDESPISQGRVTEPSIRLFDIVHYVDVIQAEV